MILAALPVLLALAFAGLLYWWFIGPSAQGPEADLSLVAAGFPSAKYKALDRLLDQVEAQHLARRNDVPADLPAALAKGRRQALLAYLHELDADFRRVHRLRARLHAEDSSPRPGVVHLLMASWARFTRLSLKARWITARGGAPVEEVARMVRETRQLYEPVGGRP
jgi:hypothetical protein